MGDGCFGICASNEIEWVSWEGGVDPLGVPPLSPQRSLLQLASPAAAVIKRTPRIPLRLLDRMHVLLFVGGRPSHVIHEWIYLSHLIFIFGIWFASVELVLVTHICFS